MAMPAPDGVAGGSLQALIGNLSAAAQALASAAGTGSTRSYDSAAKLVKSPDVFAPKNLEEEVSQWPDWSFSFKVFVGFIDPTYAEELKKVELAPPNPADYTVGERERSTKLYAILASQITAEAARQARRVEMTQEWNDEDEELNFVRLCQEFEGLVQGELRRVEEFDISSSDEVEEIEEEPTDGLMEWYQGWWFLETEVERSVRMVSEGDDVRRAAREVDACEVVLDSGADCHVLPMDWAEEVGETSNFEYHLKDAQGKVIPTLPVRQNVTFVFTKESGKKLKITDSAVCGNVTQPLFAVGKMWKLGWGTVNEDGRLWLKKGSVRIPIYFKRLERELKNELKSKEDEDGWFVLNDGTPARFDWFMGKTFDPTGKMKRSGERVLNEVDWKSMDFFECTEIWKDRERVQLGASPQARFEVMVTLLEKGLKEPSDYGLLTNLEELERELAQEGVPMEVTGTSSSSRDKKKSEKEAYQPELLQLSVGAPWDHQLKALRFKKKRIVPIDDGPGLPRLAVEADKRAEEEKRSEPSPPSDRQGSSSSSSKSSSLSGATPEAMDDESDDDDDDPGEVRTKRKAEDELVPDEMTLEEFQREVAKRNAEEEGEGSPKKEPRVDEGTGEVEERVEKVPRLGDEARGSAARVEYHIRRFAKSEDPEEHGDEYVDLDETQLFLEESREFQSKWNEKVCETEEDLTVCSGESATSFFEGVAEPFYFLFNPRSPELAVLSPVPVSGAPAAQGTGEGDNDIAQPEQELTPQVSIQTEAPVSLDAPEVERDAAAPSDPVQPTVEYSDPGQFDAASIPVPDSEEGLYTETALLASHQLGIQDSQGEEILDFTTLQTSEDFHGPPLAEDNFPYVENPLECAEHQELKLFEQAKAKELQCWELRQLLQMKDDEVCQLLGNAYGHPLEPCVFLLYTQGKLNGILGIHVDDGVCGRDAVFLDKTQTLQKTLPFGSRKFRDFVFTGIRLEQMPGFTIRASQGEYIRQVLPIDVGRNRRQNPESPATEEERSKLRGLVGSVQYAVTHTRPDIAAKLGEIQSQITTATVQTLLTANRVLREAQEFDQAVDLLGWLRALWGVVHVPHFDWRQPEKSYKLLNTALVVTDCKSLFDLVTRLAMPTCEEHRTTLEVLLIKQRCAENAQFRWIPTTLQVADSLTKNMDPSLLRTVLAQGRFRLFDTSESLARDAQRRKAIEWLQQPSDRVHFRDSSQLNIFGRSTESLTERVAMFVHRLSFQAQGSKVGG
ncbi:GIP [Symbiodinium sp. CCMP2592]|nr:GIP [Symbiodinium sp. CCMP2592]